MLFDIAGHEYFAAAHDAVVMVGGGHIIARELHYDMSIPRIVNQLFFLLGFFVVIGAVLAIISSRYKTRTLKTYFFCFAFSIYILTLQIGTFTGLYFFLKGGYFYGTLCVFAISCSFAIGHRYKKFRILLSAPTYIVPLIVFFFGVSFLLIEQLPNNIGFVSILMFYFMTPILLALYFRRFRGQDIPLRPLLIFLSGAFALFMFSSVLGFVLEYFEVLS